MEPGNASAEDILLGDLPRYGEASETMQAPLLDSSHEALPKADDQQRLAIGNTMVIRKTYSLPLLDWLVHGASIAFTIAILALCGGNVYFVDLNQPGINSILNALQLVAALHGIIVNTSLAAMAGYHLQYELCAAEGLPLGYLVTPFQLSSLQMLFKRDFWFATMAKNNNKRKYLFGAGVLAATVLTSLVHPSSAILVIPQLEWWPVNDPFRGTNGFIYLNASHSLIWPNKINETIVPLDCTAINERIPRYCPYANMAEISRWAEDYLSQFSPPNITASSDANMVRYLASSGYKDERWYSASSTATSHITRDLGDIWLYAADRHNVPFAKFGRPLLTLSSTNDSNPILRPLVQTQCGMPYDISYADTSEVTFPSNMLVPSPAEAPRAASITRQVNTRRFRNRSPTVSFIDLSTEANRSTLGALIGMSFENPKAIFGSSFKGSLGVGLMPCTIATHWVPTNMSTDPKTDNVAILDNPDPMRIVNSSELMARARSIEVDISYANKINIEVPSSGRNVLEYELKYLAFNRDTELLKYDGNWKEKWPYLVSTLISLQLSDALARVHHRMSMMVFCHGCYGHPWSVQDLGIQNAASSITDIPKKQADTFPEHIKAHPELYTPVQWNVQRYGYGWGFDSVTKWFSAAVVVLHALIVVAHLTLFFIRRWRCDSWHDILELIVLAVQSPSARSLGGASARIPTKSMYADTVKIQESETGQNAILTIGDGNQVEPPKLMTGKKYL